MSTNLQEWVDLPNIQRRALCYITAGWTPGLGCHSTSLSGLQAYLCSEYDGSRSLVSTDDEKNPVKVQTCVDHYAMGGPKTFMVSCPTEMKLAREQLLKGAAGFASVRDKVFDLIVKEASKQKCTMVIMSDNMNLGAKHRGRQTVVAYPFKISDFANWLIEKGIGHVTASPVCQNPQHRNTTDYSLCQAWIWLPPAALERVLPGSGGLYGNEQLPTLAEWRTRIAKDLAIKKEVVDAGVFVDGKNPSTFVEVVK